MTETQTPEECPHCNNPPSITYDPKPIPMRAWDWLVHCIGCEMGDPGELQGFGANEVDAIEEWNEGVRDE